MNLERLDLDDDKAVDAALELDEAVRLADYPYFPPSIRANFIAHQRFGWDGEPGEKWLLRDGDHAVGQFGVHFGHRDNLHLAYLGVLVHPEHRRKGHGRTLFEAGMERVRKEDGRRVVGTDCMDRPDFIAFAEATGFVQKMVDVHRRQDLLEVDFAEIEAHRAKAEAAASDYELLRIVDAVPDDLIDDVADMTAAINDAPTDELDIEDEIFDAKRIREFEHAQDQGGNRLYRLIARRKSDGALAGHTLVAFHPEQPEHAGQYDTSVLKDHRGHRLGMLLKASMVDWIREAEPTVRYVDTWNAESNSYMIAVNEAIGYRIKGRYLGFQRPVS